MIQIAHKTEARSRMAWIVTVVISLSAALALLGVALVARTHALDGTYVYVTPTNTQGWTSSAPLADTRANGTVAIVADADTPYGDGALSLTTGDNTENEAGQMQDKAQYMKAANVPLSSITELSYSTKQISASFDAGLPSFQLPVCLYGLNAAQTGCAVVPGTAQSSFTTLVYEPYIDQGNGAVVPGVWQSWNVLDGQLWSTRTVDGLVSTEGSITYGLASLNERFPSATLLAYGVNVGSNNPNYNTRVDGVVVNGTTYDFELTEPSVNPTPTDKNQCKQGGWKDLFRVDGTTFKNQGQCVSYVTTGRTE